MKCIPALILTAALTVAMLTAQPSRGAEPAQNWSAAAVPGVWQRGAGDSGFAWYRCFVKVPDHWVKNQRDLWVESVTLSVEQVASAHEVYVNGVKIGAAGAMPPQFGSGLDTVRRYKMPPGVLERGKFNVIAIRVYTDGAEGGFKGRAPVLAGYYLESTLQGSWQFRRGDDVKWAIGAVTTRPQAAVFEKYSEATSIIHRPSEFHGGPHLDPQQSLARMHAADDLSLDQVLTEPTVAEPLDLTFDERGRLWVVEYRQYPFPAGLKMVSRDKYYRAVYEQMPPPPPHGPRGADRISIHEDTNGDGTFDKHTVFVDGLSIATAVARGRGGVWVLNPPYLLFYPDADNDDVPDGDPVVHLAGFGLEDTHSVANSLCWGPDGWLYGAQGSTVSSQVKRPGSSEPPVYAEGATIWRYHPHTGRYEIFAEGGGNAFGIEIDSKGRLYSGHNGGTTRGFHYEQGGYYRKGAEGKYGPLSNPYAFGEIPAIATANAIPRFSHTFVMYEGAALPDRFTGNLLCVDPLHNEVVLSKVQQQGSTIGTIDVDKPLSSKDTGFRPVNIAVGPDGAVYVADFHNHYIAHGQHYQGQIDPTTGRVYRLRARGAAPIKPFDLRGRSTGQLVDLLGHKNKWFRQEALRLLGDRHDGAAVPRLAKLIDQNRGQLALDALWALNLSGGFDDAFAARALDHANPYVRAWTVRLLGDGGEVSPALGRKLAAVAESEPSAAVRCQLAATAKRIGAEYALPIARHLMTFDADADDQHIPMMLWWAIESKCGSDRDAVVAMFDEPSLWNHRMVKQTILSRLMRRLATAGTRADLLACAHLLSAAPGAEYRALLLQGFEEAYKGRPLGGLPDELAQALSSAGGVSLLLRVRRGDAAAVDEALTLIGDEKAPAAKRLSLVQTFGEVKQPRCVPVLLQLSATARDNALRQAALTALLLYDDAAIGQRVAQDYSAQPAEVRSAAQSLLVSRPAWVRAMLEAIDAGRIDPASLTHDAVAKVRLYKDATIAKMTRRLLPNPGRPTTEQMQQQIERFTRVIQSGKGNPYAGKRLFLNTCAVCHKLFDDGGAIGPNLTSYQRDNLSTMLLSIVNPSAEIREGFETFIAFTSDGRTISGFLADRDDRIVVLRGIDGQNVTLARKDIDEMRPAGMSLMPENLLGKMTDEQVRDLFAYLRTGQPISK